MKGKNGYSAVQMATFLPLDRLRERVDRERSDSDVAFFFSLLLYGEFLSKLVVSALVSAIQDDSDRNRYGALYQLVRADGIGTWVDVLDQVLIGPTSRSLHVSILDAQRQLTQKHNSGWVYDCCELLAASMRELGIETQHHGKVAVRDWLRRFANLRNKTRGHGATKASQCAAACSTLETSINLLAENLLVFRLPWAFLHQNLSGKYRVTKIGGDANVFSVLKGSPNKINAVDGVYIGLDGIEHLARVDLIDSDADATDFLVANGQFSNGHYELLSYITSDRRTVSGERYVTPVGQLPPSHTEGAHRLDVVGQTFTNIPPVQRGYVTRDCLERELIEQLVLERHPIVSLTGPGGIGKTTLALKVLHDALHRSDERFNEVIWFSARDIDLMESGPKPVRPQSVTLGDFANHLVALVSPEGTRLKQSEAIERLGVALSDGITGSSLFVFDNFETVDSSAEVFKWLDTYVRPPQKILITTRMREFVGDYPVQVGGLTDDEADQLITSVGNDLGLTSGLSSAYKAELIQESDGHPYVIKILLGEAAKEGRPAKPARIIAGEHDILTALFERTFVALSAAAQRVFLLLANWRSVVPEIALEAVVLRSRGDRINVRKALDELHRYSFVELITSETDNQVFVAVPLSAMLFGRQKLSASAMKAVIDADTELLHAFGPGQKGDVRHGALPRIRRLLRHVVKQVTNNNESLEDIEPMLEFLAGQLPSVWLDMADLYEELEPPDALAKTKRCVQHFLERPDDSIVRSLVWRRLADLCEKDDDYAGQLHAMVEMCETIDAPAHVVSSAANRINSICVAIRQAGHDVLDSDERRSLIQRAATRMGDFADTMEATDRSRLSWLHVQLGHRTEALRIAKEGLDQEPDNHHCLGLVDRLEPT